ncbi:MAG: TonB-dependent receptor, partial [Bacteroidota bacterium]
RNGEANATALFTSYRWQPSGPWSLEAGVRLPYYSPTKKLYVEPRINGSYQISDTWLLKGAYGANHQFAQELLTRNPNLVAASAPIWSLAGADERFNVQAGREVSFGLVAQPRGWLIDLEVYRKRVDGLSALTLGVEEGGITVGEQRARGLDLLVKHRRGNWRGWAIYSLSQTEWRFPERQRDTSVTKIFPADNDRRHQLRLLNTYAAGPWSFSVAWRVQSGARYTEITEVATRRQGEEALLVPRPQRGDPNAASLSVYHRLDLSAFYDWGRKGGLNGRIGLSLLNLYDQENSLERRYLIQLAGQEALQPREFAAVDVDRTGLGFTPNLRLSLRW